MPRVGLILIASWRPSDDSVQEPRLLQVCRSPTQAALDLAQEMRLHLVLHPVQVLVIPGEGEIVPVHDTLHISLWAVKAACAGLTSLEAEGLQRL
eukprot:7628794-Alexandrium_andersonii.AAC.1